MHICNECIELPAAIVEETSLGSPEDWRTIAGAAGMNVDPARQRLKLRRPSGVGAPRRWTQRSS